MTGPFPYFWWWKRRLSERRGQPCRILAWGKMNTVLVEFEDGFQVTTSRYAVRLRRVAEREVCNG